MKNLLLLSLAVLGLATSCKKDDSTPASTTMQVTAAVTGAQETTAVTTSATGNFVGTYDTSNKVLTYSITYSGFTPTSGHLHIGGPTEPLGLVFVTFANLTSPITGSVTLTDSQADALLTSGSGMYVNLHTAANKAGEIRGNLIAK